jgi:hypothetical protein
MSISASAPPPADCRARHLVVACVGLLLAVLGSSSVWAGRVVRVYEAEIKGDASVPAVQDAMRRVLVRATGRREAGNDPSLGALVMDAPKYVQSTRRATNGATQLVFDSGAIEQAIANAGRSVWERERPFTLVVFNPPLSGAIAEAARAELEKAAEYRGLPISLAPVPVLDANGVELPKDQVLQGAQRLGGDAVLIARGDSGALNGVWQWTLQTQFATENFNGSLDAGVNSAVDAMARVQEASSSLAELEARVQVSGVSTLNDYAAVSRLLEGVPGTRRVSLAETNASTATFSLLVRGGAEAVDRALGSSNRLTRSGGANSLTYEYRP